MCGSARPSWPLPLPLPCLKHGIELMGHSASRLTLMNARRTLSLSGHTFVHLSYLLVRFACPFIHLLAFLSLLAGSGCFSAHKFFFTLLAGSRCLSANIFACFLYTARWIPLLLCSFIRFLSLHCLFDRFSYQLNCIHSSAASLFRSLMQRIDF